MKNQLEFMKNMIMFDFGVDLIHESQNQRLYFKVDKAFLKFVLIQFKDPSDNFTQLSQFYILRYEIVKRMDDFIKSNKEQKVFILTTGVHVEFLKKDAVIEISLKPESANTIRISSNQEEFYKAINNDLAVFQSIRSDSSDDLIKEVSRILRFNKDDLQIQNSLTDIDLEILQFEKKILASRTKNDCLTSIYRFMLKLDSFDNHWLRDNLIENFEFVYTNDTCTCGEESCFFPILKGNQNFFFKKDYHHENKVDKKLVFNDFDSIWENAKLKQKATLGFLYSEFQNSTLLNLAFIKPDFDLNRYLFLMCYPYQPDSKDENWVRTVSTLAHCFMQFSKQSRSLKNLDY